MSIFISQGACLLGSQLHPVTAKWIYNIKATDSSKAPTVIHTLAIDYFYKELVRSGLGAKMKMINFFYPGDIIAAQHPFYAGLGYQKWTNNNFTNSDLSVNGLHGDGDSVSPSRYFKTGIIPSTHFSTFSQNIGFTIWVTERASSTLTTIYHGEFGAIASSSNDAFISSVYYDEDSYRVNCYDNDGINDRYNSNSFTSYTGLLSFNRTGATDNLTFHNYSSSDIQNLGIATMGTEGTYSNINRECYAFAVNDAAGNPAFHTGERLSFMALHNALNISELRIFRTLIYNLRVALGGGY